MAEPITHPLLDSVAGEHGFGVRGVAPEDVLRPKQVHGTCVAFVGERRTLAPAEADAVVCDRPGQRVAVVTADCVPILLAARDGRAVAAIHAGWRGLAAGVVGAGVRALAARCGGPPRLVAAIGPYIGPCCYEVDAPVIDALRAAFAGDLDAALSGAPAGHAMLDLGRLVVRGLLSEGLRPEAVGSLAGACTCCDPERFHSYRRDGARAGRLVHFIAARNAQA